MTVLTAKGRRNPMLEIGKTHTMTHRVTPETTAIALKSGSLAVLATPVMIAWMEECCLECVQPALEPGFTTVGTQVNVTHEAPTPVGNEVTVRCRLEAADSRCLTFSVEASDSAGVIGRGSHQRFIVDGARFQAKCDRKRDQ